MLDTNGNNLSVKNVISLTNSIDHWFKKFDFWSIVLFYRLKIFFQNTINLINVFCCQLIISIDPDKVFLAIGAHLWSCPAPTILPPIVPIRPMSYSWSWRMSTGQVNPSNNQHTFYNMAEGEYTLFCTIKYLKFVYYIYIQNTHKFYAGQ
jgi:hypothetical protein